MGVLVEHRNPGFSVVVQRPRLHKDGVGEHVDIAIEIEALYLGIVSPLNTLDELSVLVLEGSSTGKGGYAVLGVVIKVPGPKCVLVLVLKLDNSATELGEILIDQIVELVTAQNRAVLDDLDMTYRLDNIIVDIP